MSDTITHLTGYKIKASDYNGFWQAYLRHNYWTRSRFLGTLGYMVLLLAINAMATYNHKPDLVDIAIVCVFAISLPYIIVPVFAYLNGLVKLASGKAVKVQHNLSIASEGLTKSSSLATVSVPWNALYALEETRSTILFFTNRSCAIILPKSAFNSPSEAEGFLAAARNYIDQAKAQTG